MNSVELKQFKKELAELLKKYDVCIGCIADNGSDWYGITGEEIVVSPNNSDKTYNLCDGLWVDHHDLLEE